MTTLDLDEAPNLTVLLAKAAATSFGRRGDVLPDTELRRTGVTIERDHVAAYAEVCGFPVGDSLPPTYLHLLGFPLSVQLMTDRSFPFPLAGLVHVRNRIIRHRPVAADEVVDVAVHLADLRSHPKGRQFDVVAEVTAKGEVAWSSRSTYLKRGRGDEGAEEDVSSAGAVDVAALPFTAQWRVPGDIGRRYGAVSGDRNPIHMSALAARAFGFPKAIAHGMWTKARCLAAFEGRLPNTFEVDVQFKLPILLPATVHHATRADGQAWQFAVRSRSGKPHLAGTIVPS